MSTSQHSREQQSQSGEENIDQILNKEQHATKTLSPIKKSSLRSPNKSINNTINQYEAKYIKKPFSSGSGVPQNGGRRSSVVAFDVPNNKNIDHVKSEISSDSLHDDSLMDDDLAKWLEETSISEDIEVSKASSTAKQNQQSLIKSNKVVTSNSSVREQHDRVRKISPVKLALERKLSSASLSPEKYISTNSEVSRGYKSKGNEGRPFSRSLSIENSDLKSVPEEVMDDDRTISTITDKSPKKSLLKSRRSIFRSSTLEEDDSTSSSSQQYLAKRISRRNSYIYKEECDLVSAASSECIETESQVSTISDENEQFSDKFHAQIEETSTKVNLKLTPKDLTAENTLPTFQKQNSSSLRNMYSNDRGDKVVENSSKNIPTKENNIQSSKKLWSPKINSDIRSSREYSTSEVYSDTPSASPSTDISIPSGRHKHTKRDRRKKRCPQSDASKYSSSSRESSSSFKCKCKHKRQSRRLKYTSCTNCEVSLLLIAEQVANNINNPDISVLDVSCIAVRLCDTFQASGMIVLQSIIF